MKKIFMTLVCILSFTAINAQNNEVYILLNPSTLHADGADGLSPFGIAAGYNRQVDLGCDNALKLIAGGKINYAWTSKNSVDWSFLKIAIPVSVGYHFQTGKLGIMPYAGIDASFYPLAQIKGNGETKSLFDEDEVTDLLKASRLQLGWQVGVDFDYQNFVLGIGYQSDFTKFQDNVVGNVKTKTYFSEVEIKLGYRF